MAAVSGLLKLEQMAILMRSNVFAVTLVKRSTAAAVFLMLCGCGGTDPFAGTAFKFKPDEFEPKPFVKAARKDPAQLDYLPIGFEDVPRKTAVKTPAQAAADTQSLATSGEQAKSRLAAPVAKSKGLSPEQLKKKRKALIDGQDPAQ